MILIGRLDREFSLPFQPYIVTLDVHQEKETKLPFSDKQYGKHELFKNT